MSDHGFIQSIYFRDPNGYVIELTAKIEGHDAVLQAADNNTAREKLGRWLARRRETPSPR